MDKELDALLSENCERVNKAHIEGKIADVFYSVLPNSTVIVCSITMENGYVICGESPCVESKSFNMEVGRQVAYRNAFSKIWPLESYLQAERRYLETKR